MSPTTSPGPVLPPEHADLLEELATVRAGLVATTDGLSDAQVGEKPTASALCLLGLVKHVASTEEAWMRFVVEGPSAMSFDLPDGVTWASFMDGTASSYPQWAIDRQADFAVMPGDTLAGALARYEQVAERTREVVAASPDLSVSQDLPAAPWNDAGSRHSIRRVLVHLVAETAQHTGHAEILRETLDGRTST